MRRILVASDFEAHSRPALRLALDLAAQAGATVIALHVLDDGGDDGNSLLATLHAMGGAGALSQRDEMAARLLLERELSACRPRGHRPPPTEVLVRTGPVADTILLTAAAAEADLIVLGTGKRAGKLGPVTEVVSRRAERAVLAVPQPPEEREAPARVAAGAGALATRAQ
jgi:nucleotide-binding universal stress UspA family protein